MSIRDQAGACLNRARSVSDGLRSPVANAPGSEGGGDGETAPVTVTIQVVAQGARGCASALREPLSLGVDRVRLIVPDRDALTPASAAAALATVIGPTPGFDLILGGESPDDQEDGLLVRLLAQAWDIPFAGNASRVTLGPDGHILLIDSTERLRPLPLAVAVDKGLTLREFTTAGYLSALSKKVELIRWPRKVESYPVELAEGEQLSTSTISTSESFAGPFDPEKAAIRLLEELGLDRMAAPPTPFGGPIEDVPNATLPGDGRATVVGILAADTEGRLRPSAISTLKAVRLLAAAIRAEPVTLLVAPPDDSLQRQAVAQSLASGRWDVLLVTTLEAGSPLYGQMLIDCWPDPVEPPLVVVGEPWTELAFAILSRRQRNPGPVALRVRQVKVDQGKMMLASSRARGKLQAWQTLDLRSGVTPWISLVADADIQDRDAALSRAASGVSDAPGTGASGRKNATHGESLVRVRRWTPGDTPRSGSFSKRSFGTKAGGEQEAARVLDEIKQEIGVARLADADFIVDVGFGVGNRDGYEAVIEPLERALRELGVRSLAIGGSRKVTEELHLLPADRQIGQSGVSVNPRILLAIGISGAPQHLNYIGSRTTIVAFNRDAEAPMMTLNQRQPRPRVFPIVGDLFETVPAFIAALQKETSTGRAASLERRDTG